MDNSSGGCLPAPAGINTRPVPLKRVTGVLCSTRPVESDLLDCSVWLLNRPQQACAAPPASSLQRGRWAAGREYNKAFSRFYRPAGLLARPFALSLPHHV